MSSLGIFCTTCSTANTLCHEIVKAKATEHVNQCLRQIIYTIQIFDDVFKGDTTMHNLLTLRIAKAMLKCFEVTENTSVLEFEFINYIHKHTGCPEQLVVSLCKLMVDNSMFRLNIYPRVWESIQHYIMGELYSYSVEYHIPLGREKTQYKLIMCIMFEPIPQCSILLEDTFGGKSFQDETFQVLIRINIPEATIYNDGFGFIRIDITDMNITKITEVICEHFGNGVFTGKELLIPQFRIARQFNTVKDWIPIEEMNFYREIMTSYIDHLEIEENLAIPFR